MGNIFKDFGKEEVFTLVVSLSDISTDLTTGTKDSFLVPCDMRIKNVKASVNTAPTGATIIADIQLDGSTIFLTKPTINTTKLSTISSQTEVAFALDRAKKDQTFTFIIDQVGSTIAGKGLRLYIDYNKI